MPAGHLGVRLAVAGGEPGPRAQLGGVFEPGHVPDLGDDDRGVHRADAGQLLDHLVAAVAGDSMVISVVSSPVSCRSEVTFPAYGWGRHSPSSHCRPLVPNKSECVTGMPSLASTAWTWSLVLLRSAMSFCLYLVSSLSSRTSRGAIHASASRPIRSKSAKSLASRTSFLTRR